MTGAFSAAAVPTHGFVQHEATLIADGRVLVAGAYVSERTDVCGDGLPKTADHPCSLSSTRLTWAAASELFDPTAERTPP